MLVLRRLALTLGIPLALALLTRGIVLPALPGDLAARCGADPRRLGVFEYALYVPRALQSKRPQTPTELMASLPLATQYGDPELDVHLRTSTARAGITLAPRLICETFPQAERAMRSGRFAAVLPLLEDPPAGAQEVRSPLFGARAKMFLTWHARLERRGPRAKAMIDALGRALSRN